MNFKRPDKYSKRPEYMDVDNAVHKPIGKFVYNGPGFPVNGVNFPIVGAGPSGHQGARPYMAQQVGLTQGNPVQTRNRKSPNPLEEHQ